VGIYRPASNPSGDVLYLHGFGDRLDNHGPLFRAWTGAGLRVVSFDFPYHGESTATGGYGIGDIGGWALAVERATREEPGRPLILSGWSTGGLAAVRAAQARLFDGERPLRGLILIAPAVAPRMVVGEAGRVTGRTLTRNPAPPHRGPIQPDTPFALKSLAVSILASAGLSWRPLPPEVPALVIVAGREDRYVKSRKVLQWVSARRKEGARLSAVECPAAYHELDNEPDPTGSAVRAAAAIFAVAAAVAGAPAPGFPDSGLGDCRTFGEGASPPWKGVIEVERTPLGSARTF
jgi:alpha-beta hydrolase superfamily lysophospholipase